MGVLAGSRCWPWAAFALVLKLFFFLCFVSALLPLCHKGLQGGDSPLCSWRSQDSRILFQDEFFQLLPFTGGHCKSCTAESASLLCCDPSLIPLMIREELISIWMQLEWPRWHPEGSSRNDSMLLLFVAHTLFNPGWIHQVQQWHKTQYWKWYTSFNICTTIPKEDNRKLGSSRKFFSNEATCSCVQYISYLSSDICKAKPIESTKIENKKVESFS